MTDGEIIETVFKEGRWVIEFDNEGQLIIYSGLRLNSDCDKLVPFEETT